MNDYYNKPGISSGLIKALSIHPTNAEKVLYEKEKKTTEALSFGSFFDDKVLQPHTVDEKYQILYSKKPTEKMLDLANAYVNIYFKMKSKEGFDIEHNKRSIILEARESINYNKSLIDETVISKFEKECGEYTEEQISSIENNKIAVTKENNDLSNRLIEQMKLHPSTAFLFDPSSLGHDVEILFQHPVYFKHKIYNKGNPLKFECKALLDIVIIDNKQKEITGIDLKTYDGSFMKNFYRFRYYYQGSWYYLALLYFKSWFKDIKDYSVQNFKFITIDKNEVWMPKIYSMSVPLMEEIIHTNKDKESDIEKYELSGDRASIRDLLLEYNFRIKTNNWKDTYDMLIKGYHLINKL